MEKFIKDKAEQFVSEYVKAVNTGEKMTDMFDQSFVYKIYNGIELDPTHVHMKIISFISLTHKKIIECESLEEKEKAYAINWVISTILLIMINTMYEMNNANHILCKQLEDLSNMNNSEFSGLKEDYSDESSSGDIDELLKEFFNDDTDPFKNLDFHMEPYDPVKWN